MSAKRLHVVIGIIVKDNKVCIAKRAANAHLGGLWEFPGGKVERHENALTALKRELHEEIGIQVNDAKPLLELPYDYPERQVLLDFWRVTEFNGEPHGREGQPVEWVALTDLAKYQFPDANQPIVKRLQNGML